MNVTVKKLTSDQSIIEVETGSGVKTLEVNRTEYGFSWEDYAEWDITDDEYEALDEFIDSIRDQMDGKDTLNVTYELD